MKPYPQRSVFSALEPAAWGGLLLLFSAAVALILANSPWAAPVHDFWQTEVSLGSASFGIHKPLLLWINDGLMAVFFLLIGLEIKRELLEGALSTRRKAMLPVLAAVGGIAVPALIYTLVNLNDGDPAGWAVPAATDSSEASSSKNRSTRLLRGWSSYWTSRSSPSCLKTTRSWMLPHSPLS